MNVLLGIGNFDKGDDGVGSYVARHLNAEGWMGIECGTAPENFTGVVRQQSPERIVMVDATDMGLAPGAIRRIARDQVEDVGIGTHMLPLYHLIDYLAEVTTDIVLIGIQPKSVGYGEPLCEEVQAAAEAVAEFVATDRMDEIEPIADS